MEWLDTITGWWKSISDWWGSLWGWLDGFFGDLTTIFDSWGILDWVNEFVLSWGDWIVGWARAIVVGAVSYLVGAFFWRAITYFLGVAVVSQATFVLKTGFATYLIVWFIRVAMRSAGIGFVTFVAWQTNLLPKIESGMVDGINAIPKEFKPMMEYFSVLDAIHFLFSVFVIIATLKVSMWVFKPPLDL
jgi:hypothetical protein